MAWLTGWSYRKTIIIAPSADGAQTDYQLKLLVGESAGVSGCQVHCAGHVLSSFNDLRFTTSDGGTLCDYWIESITGATPNQLATVWIKVPSLAASPADTTIYMYYGNAAASAVSNGTDTFLFFDDFELNNLTRWTATGTWATQSSVVKKGTYAAYAQTASSQIYKAISGYEKFALHLFVRRGGGNYYQWPVLIGQASGNRIVAAHNSSGYFRYYDGAYHDFPTPVYFAVDTWYELDIYFDLTTGVESYIFKVDGESKGTVTTVLDDSALGTIRHQCSNVAGNPLYLDDVWVRKWTPNEPSFSSFGTEEIDPSSYHVILSATYSQEAPEINRTFVVGSDAAGGQVSGSAVAQADVDLVGERMDAHHSPAVPSGTVAAAVAAAMLAKCRLDGRRAELVVPPHCGLELWDVLAVIDTVANQDTLYRVSGYQLEYDTVKGAYFHRLQLCAV